MARIQVLRSVRRFCLECQGHSTSEVRACADRDCPLWLWRLGDREDLIDLPKADKCRIALRSVRVYCLSCAGQRQEVRLCTAREHCLLWSLRFGVYPETYKKVRQRFFAPKKLLLWK